MMNIDPNVNVASATSSDVRCRSDQEKGPKQSATIAPADERLLERFEAGEREALDELFRRNKQPAYAIAHRILGNEADALDAVQDGFVKALTHLRQFQKRSSFKTWLLRVVITVALKHRERRSRRQVREGQCAANRRVVEWRGPPDELLLKELPEEAAAILQRADDRLPRIYQCLLAGWSYQEIAREIGRSKETVKKAVARLRAFLLLALVKRGLLP